MIKLNYYHNNRKYREILSGIRPDIELNDFHAFAFNMGFQPDDVSAICNRSPKTVKRWEADGAEPWAYLLLYACSGRVLNKNWHHYQFRDNELYTGSRITYNNGFTPAQLQEYTFYMQYLHDLKRENDRLRKSTNTNIEIMDIKRRFTA